MSDFVEVHSKLLWKEVFESPLDEKEKKPDIIKIKPNGTGSEKIHESDQYIKANDWLTTRSRRVMVLPDDEELCTIENICQKISDENKKLTLELERSIKSHELVCEHKRETLFKKWNEQVFKPLQTAVCKFLNGDYFSCFETTKRELFTYYLSLSNKDQIFLDSLPPNIPTLEHGYVKVRLEDPLFPRDFEGGKCRNRKDDTKAIHWLAMYLIQIDSTARIRSRCRIQRVHNETTSDTSELRLSHIPRISHKDHGILINLD